MIFSIKKDTTCIVPFALFCFLYFASAIFSSSAFCSVCEKFTPMRSASAFIQYGIDNVFLTNRVLCLSRNDGINASTSIKTSLTSRCSCSAKARNDDGCGISSPSSSIP